MLPLMQIITGAVSAGLTAQSGLIDAGLLRQQARTSRQQGTVDADSLSRDFRQLIGTQAAAMAQAGGTYDGSNAKLLAQSEFNANFDRLKTLYRSELRARGLEIDAKQAIRQGYIGAATQLLSTGSSGYTGGKSMPGGY